MAAKDLHTHIQVYAQCRRGMYHQADNVYHITCQAITLPEVLQMTTMALSEVDSLHHSLMRFAERTNDFVCSANSSLESLVHNHPLETLTSLTSVGEKGYSSSLEEIMNLEGRIGKRSRLYIPPQSVPSGPSSDSSERLVSIRERTAPSLRPILPVEILDGIFRLLDQQKLYPVLLSNRFLYQIARRRFYHTVTIRSPRDAIAFLQNLLHNPDLPAFVRFFELSIVVSTGKSLASVDPSSSLQLSSSSTSSSPLFTYNFYSLLHRGLRAMHSLFSLTFELPKSHSPVWILYGCTFMLRQFTTSMHCNRQLAEFLERQNMIEDLTLRGFQSETLFLLPFLGPATAAFVAQGSSSATTTTSDNSVSPLSFSLSPSALSRLKSFNAIHAGPGVIQTIMQGRSVEIVSIPLFPERSISTLNALGSGKTSLRRLSVISFDPGAPEFLFEELSQRFKDLEALHLVLLMADYTIVSS